MESYQVLAAKCRVDEQSNTELTVLNYEKLLIALRDELLAIGALKIGPDEQGGPLWTFTEMGQIFLGKVR